eukprot:TRINITY_DN7250_c0_g2_i1.p1 TRINITY_DN7250_c0_g2~~TRINITY_DN7250_c0_g2_i1.p1  ORF type:complete len:362 (+),score=49.24 TRINITY_DN7250_c0_g2_i1:93-1178(+)
MALRSLFGGFALSMFAMAHSSDDDIHRQFDTFQRVFNKHYESSQERDARFEAFSVSYRFIQANNVNGNSFMLGLNAFSDLSAAQFYKTHFGGASNSSSVLLGGTTSLGMHESPTDVTLPKSKDWRDDGAVTPVKDQGDCGSCWSFSTTGALEGAWKIAGGGLIPLSEQQFLECDFGTGGILGNSNWACGGGEPYWAFDYAKGASICSEPTYRYTGKDPNTKVHAQELCKKSQGQCEIAIPKGAVKGYKLVSRFSESALLSAVAQQPVSIGIAASSDLFRHYHSGVMSRACGFMLDHAVLLVGYGTESSDNYWLVKNSWGPSWGEEGYVRLIRGKIGAGECGIKTSAHYPVVEKSSEANFVV